MRERFNLDLTSLERFTMLIHGNYGGGKTFFLGDMLRAEKQHGPVRYINMKGEDGHLSIAGMGLGEIGETVETLKDLKESLADAKAQGVRAIGLDGFKVVGEQVIRSVCGDRLPSVGKGSDDWQKIHREFDTLVKGLRQYAPIIVCASSSDRSMDQVSGEISLTPDLPGRQAAGVGGMFDFVFLLKSMVSGPTSIKRVLQTAPVANTVIRYRLPKALPNEIEIPNGMGGWDKVLTELQKCLLPGKKG